MLKARQFPKEVLLAVTHCHDLQNEIIISPTAKSMASVYSEMLLRSRDLTVKKVYAGRVIDLPPSVHSHFESRVRFFKISAFRVHINRMVAQFYHKTKELPPGTSKCRCFDRLGEYELFHSCISEDDSDYKCHQCKDAGFVLVNRDWDSWFAEKNMEDISVPCGTTEYESFYIITSDPGHHNKGTNIEHSSKLDEFSPECVHGFFYGEEVGVPAEIVTAQEEFANREVDMVAKILKRTERRDLEFIQRLSAQFELSSEEEAVARNKFMKKVELAWVRQ